MRKKILFLCLLHLLYQVANAQTYAADANIIEKGYVSPTLSGYTTALNQAWCNTAKPQSFKGFNVNLTRIFVVGLPTSYYVDNTKLSTIELLSPAGNAQSGNVPTSRGASTAPRYKERLTNHEFDGDKGYGNQFHLGFLQVGYGFSNNSEVKLRVGLKKDTYSYGIGVQHDIKHYFKKMQSSPYDISVFAGYTQLVQSTSRVKFSAKVATIQGLISRLFFNHLTVFGGVGYNVAVTALDIKDYKLYSGAAAIPINISETSSGPRATVGLKIQYSSFMLNTDFTLQKYPSITIGLGFGAKQKMN